MSTLPYARLSTFYFIYFAAVGAFVPYWSLFLDARGLGTVAIGALMSLWYGTRIVSPSIWSILGRPGPAPGALAAHRRDRNRAAPARCSCSR
jgi:PPP family 3-phenylpropionic acid transporter